MPLTFYKKGLLREAQKKYNTVTIFYKKRNNERVRREIEPYEVVSEKTKKGLKTFLYGVDVSKITPPNKQTIKKFDVDEIGAILINENSSFVPQYNMVPIK